MEIRFALLADCANLTADGKLNIMGVFEQVNAPTLPFQLPTMFLVMSFSASPAEIGREKKLQVVLLDDEGKPQFQLETAAVVPEAPRAGTRAVLMSIVGLNNVVFRKSGDYQFSILVNDEEKHTLSLKVNECPGVS